MMVTKQIILGTCPSKANNYRPALKTNRKTGKVSSGFAKNEIVKQYEKDFIIQYRLTHPMITGKFGFSAKIFVPTEQHDLDGVFKIIFDCLKKVGAIKDDKKLYKFYDVEKFIDEKNPRIEFELYEL